MKINFWNNWKGGNFEVIHFEIVSCRNGYYHVFFSLLGLGLSLTIKI